MALGDRAKRCSKDNGLLKGNFADYRNVAEQVAQKEPCLDSWPVKGIADGEMYYQTCKIPLI